MDTDPAPQRPLVAIRYCPKCRWLTRAAWLAQELLITFPDEIDVLLSPGASGIFDVTLDGALLFSRAAAERFPEPKELKKAIRDRIDPERSLGHSDR
ncbi:SelT/SelW/SelH family protein [Sorangium sp. So ce233]|uniref:SelT/SelW/SelH family protein n=1 Tax=Sorangium sp. So ce233 TaxID=3133290 RepID=UPI003F62D8E1